MPHLKNRIEPKPNRSHLGFEATLWATADKRRGNLDAAESPRLCAALRTS